MQQLQEQHQSVHNSSATSNSKRTEPEYRIPTNSCNYFLTSAGRAAAAAAASISNNNNLFGNGSNSNAASAAAATAAAAAGSMYGFANPNLSSTFNEEDDSLLENRSTLYEDENYDTMKLKYHNFRDYLIVLLRIIAT